jgi:hypothetical protein
MPSAEHRALPRHPGARSGVGSSDPTTDDVAAPNPTVGLGLEMALELHEAPDLGPVYPYVWLDMRGRLRDGGQIDAEKFGAALQQCGNRPSIGRIIRFPSPHEPKE